MNERTPERIAAIRAESSSLIEDLKSAVQSAARANQAVGAAASRIRGETMIACMDEDDPDVCPVFESTQRTAALLEELARDSANLLSRMIDVSRQLGRDGDELERRRDYATAAAAARARGEEPDPLLHPSIAPGGTMPSAKTLEAARRALIERHGGTVPALPSPTPAGGER